MCILLSAPTHFIFFYIVVVQKCYELNKSFTSSFIFWPFSKLLQNTVSWCWVVMLPQFQKQDLKHLQFRMGTQRSIHIKGLEPFVYLRYYLIRFCDSCENKGVKSIFIFARIHARWTWFPSFILFRTEILLLPILYPSRILGSNI